MSREWSELPAKQRRRALKVIEDAALREAAACIGGDDAANPKAVLLAIRVLKDAAKKRSKRR